MKKKKKMGWGPKVVLLLGGARGVDGETVGKDPRKKNHRNQ